ELIALLHQKPDFFRIKRANGLFQGQIFCARLIWLQWRHGLALRQFLRSRCHFVRSRRAGIILLRPGSLALFLGSRWRPNGVRTDPCHWQTRDPASCEVICDWYRKDTREQDEAEPAPAVALRYRRSRRLQTLGLRRRRVSTALEHLAR